MNIPVKIDDSVFERLSLAHKVRKYSHLETWKELFLFQISCANQAQVMEISEFAKRKNKGERITLPLKMFIQSQLT